MDELAARIRAARAYAGLGQKELAEKIGLSQQTQKRSEHAADPFREPGEDELRKIAHVCGMPYEFFIWEWTAEPEPQTTEARLRTLEERVFSQQLDALLAGALPAELDADLTQTDTPARDAPATQPTEKRQANGHGTH